MLRVLVYNKLVFAWDHELYLPPPSQNISQLKKNKVVSIFIITDVFISLLRGFMAGTGVPMLHDIFRPLQQSGKVEGRL